VFDAYGGSGAERWTWKGAAALANPLLEHGGRERLRWSGADVLASLEVPPDQRAPAARA
jgi:hypothetical protein